MHNVLRWQYWLRWPKYLQLYFQRTLQFRAEIFVWAVLDTVPFAVLFVIWGHIYQGQTSINGFTLATMIQYYLLVMIISSLTDVHFELLHTQKIVDGKVDQFFSRPFNLIEAILAQDISSRIFFTLLHLPFILALSLFFSTNPVSLTWVALWAVPLVIAAYAMQVMVGLWIVLTAFWLESARGLDHFKMVSLTLFSGSIIPIEFMPEWMARIVELLPLKFLYATPIRLLQTGQLPPASDTIYLVCCLVGMVLFTNWLWHQAKYQYTSAGG